MTEEQFIDLTRADVRKIDDDIVAIDLEVRFSARRELHSAYLSKDELDFLVEATKHRLAHDMYAMLADEFRDESEVEDAYQRGYMAGRRGMQTGRIDDMPEDINDALWGENRIHGMQWQTGGWRSMGTINGSGFKEDK